MRRKFPRHLIAKDSISKYALQELLHPLPQAVMEGLHLSLPKRDSSLVAAVQGSVR
jgi:hypothetical protein